MEDSWDMAAVSLPFTAGVAAGAAVEAALAGGGPAGLSSSGALRSIAGSFPGPMTAGFIAGAALLAAAGLLYTIFRRRTDSLPYLLLFFLAGLFCCLSAGALPRPEAGPVGRMAAGALAGLRRLIASIPFGHDSTGSLVSALLTGDRSGLTPEQTAAFRGSGASHILALSGLHLGVIYLIVSRVLSVIGNTPVLRRFRSFLIVLLSGFYTVGTGAGPSIVRAFLFILIRETCSLFPERHTSPVRILMTALTLQLAFRPDVITTLGFQLSYLAMTGITVLYPRFSAWYPSAPSPDSPSIWSSLIDPLVCRIWQAAALTVSCQVFTAPLVWIRFHTFPRFFLITNLLALPLTSSLMASAVTSIILQGLGASPAATHIFASLTDFLAQALLFTLDVISSL